MNLHEMLCFGKDATLKLSLHTPWRHTGDGGIPPLVLNLGTRRIWVVSLALQPLYPLSRRLGGIQSQSGRFGEVTNFLLLLGFETLMVSL